MPRSLPLSVLLLIAPCALDPLVAGAQGLTLDVTLEVLAVSGDPVPGTPGAFYERLPTPPLVDAEGRLVFQADVGGDTSATGGQAILWADPAGPVQVGLRASDVPTGAGPGVTVTQLRLVGFADGRILTLGQLAGPGVVATRNDALIVKQGSQPGKLVADADTGGLPPDTFIAEIRNARIARGGNVAFIADLAGAAVSDADRRAIFGPEAPGGDIVMLARRGFPVGGDASAGVLYDASSLTVNAVGEIAFLGRTQLGQSYPWGVFGPTGSSPLRRLVAADDPLSGIPPTHRLVLYNTFTFPNDPAPQLTHAGDTIFYGECAPAGWGIGGIWRHRLDGAIEPRVVTCPNGLTLPDGSRLARIDIGRHAANQAGTIAFSAHRLNGDISSPDTAWRSHSDGHFELLTELRQPIPGRPGEFVLRTSFEVDLNESGDALFNVLSIGSLLDHVVFAPAEAPAISPIARLDPLQIDGQTRTITRIDLAKIRHESRRAFSEEGTLGVRVLLDDGRYAIVRIHYPITRDSDADGAPDWGDTCPFVVDTDQLDRDGDGVGDACNDGDDADGDEFADALDNCPDDTNADQADADGDGLGDACDPFPDEVDHEKAQLRLDLTVTTDELLACLDRPIFVDTDGDGEADSTDACAATPAGSSVDAAGCSQEQFCRTIEGAGFRGVLACWMADWRGDETWRVMPGDCSASPGRGWWSADCGVAEIDSPAASAQALGRARAGR